MRTSVSGYYRISGLWEDTLLWKFTYGIIKVSIISPNCTLLLPTFETLTNSSQHDLLNPKKFSTDSLSDLSYPDTRDP